MLVSLAPTHSELSKSSICSQRVFLFKPGCAATGRSSKAVLNMYRVSVFQVWQLWFLEASLLPWGFLATSFGGGLLSLHCSPSIGSGHKEQSP